MKRVLTAIVLVPLVLLAVFRAPAWLFALLVGAVAMMAAREFVDLVKHYNVSPFRTPTFVVIALMFLALVIRGLQQQTPTIATETLFYIIFTAFAFAAFVFLVIGMLRRDLATSYPAASAAFFALGYCAVPLLLLANIRQQWAGAF